MNTTQKAVPTGIATIALLAAITVFAFAYYAYEKSVPVATGEKTDVQQSTVKGVSINESTDYARIEGEYPQVTGASAEFNAQIEEVAKRNAREHAVLAEETWKERFASASEEEKRLITEKPSKLEDKFPLIISFTTGATTPALSSVLVTIEGFTGGAHGFITQQSFTYSKERGGNIAVDTLFPGVSMDTVLQKLSTAAVASITAEVAARMTIPASEVDTVWIKEGAAPTLENFSIFKVNDNNTVTFYFGQYQVAAYAAGMFEVTLPLPRGAELPTWMQ